MMEEKRISLKIVSIYVFLAELWVLFSHGLIFSFSYRLLLDIRYEILIDSVFILVTGAILYFLIYNYIIRKENVDKGCNYCKEKYKLIVNSTTDGIWEWKVGTNECKLSPTWKKKLGYSEWEIEDSFEAWKKLVHPQDLDYVLKELDGYIKKSIPAYRVEYRIKKKDGEWMWALAQGKAIWNEKGEPVYIIGTHIDITERKKAEESLKEVVKENKKLLNKMMEIDRLKTEFIADISHELKTPLNVILGTVQMLNIYKEDYEIKIEKEKFKKYISLMTQNCYRLLRLINNVIDINKIDSGFMKLNLDNYNIINIIEEITLSVAEFAADRGIKVIFDTEVEEKVLACDPDKIERIMLNLLSNAIKHTKPGGRIYVTVYDKGENVLISVKDTGIGIPKDKLKTIFTRYNQLNSSNTKVNEGSGIGLSLVKSLVEMHTGEIWAKSQYGEGSEFLIRLPVKTLLSKECKESKEEYYSNDHVERLKIEFSDIYSS